MIPCIFILRTSRESFRNMALPFKPSFPWLLYAYPWMPYPRRVIIYLREKQIPEHLVRVVRVSDPGDGNQVVDAEYFPPRPPGSLPVLAIPSKISSEGSPEEWLYVRQSMAIINFLEELCEAGSFGFSSPRGSLTGSTALERFKNMEVQTLAEEVLVAWNPVRTFGTDAGPFHDVASAKEMLRWVRRTMLAINTYLSESDRDLASLADDSHPITIADVVLYQFLEFTMDCYHFDATTGSGQKVVDVYGREVDDDYPKVRKFYEAFSRRRSAKRVADFGEVPGEKPAKAMATWVEGVL